ncbi:helix-turn-helix transcriptional regulator [Salmonella enterica]|nr:helix-turn-helix transcriptional regulator [Salmonella enterica]VEA96161.1 response regulator [Salmonella enterica subsp. houtenae]
MSNNIPIIVLTSCRYLLAGLEGLMSDSLMRLLHAGNMKEVCELQAVTGAEMIIVARESGAPDGLVWSRAQLRRLDWLMLSGRLQRVPCLLLAEDMSMTVAGKTFWLPGKDAALDLKTILSEVLAHPALYVGMAVWCPLSAQQQKILEGTLAGLDVYELAEKMHVLPRTVFVYRDMLIKKLGLRNRMELMFLSVEDFTEGPTGSEGSG